MAIRFFIFFSTFFILCGCGSRHAAELNGNKQIMAPMAIEYAKGFSITRLGRFTLIKVFNPWEGAKGIEYSYLLCPRGESIPDSLGKFPIIYTPVKRIICLSTTHVAQLAFIGEVSSLVGVANPDFIGDTLVQKMIANGKITNVGYDQAINYEAIVSLKPDLVMAYGIQAETMNQYRKLEDLGIKVVLNGEYLEATPLGKLEWVKFLSAFYNVFEQTSEKFNKVEQEYNQLSKMCANLKDKPKVMSGIPWKGVWYVPGGDSYVAKMISDAGGDYIWKNIKQRESVPLNFEKVIEHANEADIWINVGLANSLNDIFIEDERLNRIKSFKEKNVYNNNARSNAKGGNEFWESGLVQPEIILKDMIKIFHPKLLPGYSLVYYKKLD